MRLSTAQKTTAYSHRTYKNPFFQRRRRKPVARTPLKVKFFIALAIIIATGLFWFIFYHNFFAIENFEIEGNKIIQENIINDILNRQLEKTYLFFFNQSNIFSFSKRQTRREILKRYYVENLTISKKLLHTIKIKFNEINPAAIWLEDDIYYYIDENLNIISKAEILDLNNVDFIILTNEKKEPSIVEDGLIKKIIINSKNSERGKSYLNFALNLTKKLQSINFHYSRTFSINEPETTLNIGVVDGPVIYFNIENDLESQFRFLDTLLKEKIKGEENLKKLQYIDLRFGEKIYYK